MNTTSFSLLERLKRAPPDAPDWRRLEAIYRPLIHAWLSRIPGLRDEADDLTQEVLLVVLRELPSFVRQRDGAFRAWLRQVTVNRIRAFCKARQKRPRAGVSDEVDALLAQLADGQSDQSRQWERDHDRHVLQKLLALVRPDFEPNTWQAFTRFALDGLPALEVAQELGMSESAVVQSKFRVLKRLREEARDLVD
jgi:RNA polymerase sigma-70 factor (ECF subfamily)